MKTLESLQAALNQISANHDQMRLCVEALEADRAPLAVQDAAMDALLNSVERVEMLFAQIQASGLAAQLHWENCWWDWYWAFRHNGPHAAQYRAEAQAERAERDATLAA